MHQSNDPILVAIAKAMNMNHPIEDCMWSYASPEARRNICWAMNQRFSGKWITVCACVDELWVNKLFLQLDTECDYLLLCAIEWRRLSDIKTEFVKGSVVTMKVRFKEITLECGSDLVPTVVCTPY